MSAVQFESLLDLVKHQIVKKDTKFRAQFLLTSSSDHSLLLLCPLAILRTQRRKHNTEKIGNATLSSLRDSKSLQALTEDRRPSRESKKSHFHL
ncbi:protein Hydra magnipapillata [Nesidiocoris tenuis]|nr:protein Hydra magnipapillata [Nesidiocoris tenuis]